MGLKCCGNINIQRGFFGAHGLNLPEGLTDVSADEADIKRILAGMCRQTVAVLDATKWGAGWGGFLCPTRRDWILW